MTRVPEEEAQGRYQEVLAWRAEGLTYADIGQRLGVSKMRVREITEQAQRWQQRQSLEALPISAAAKAALWRAGLRTAEEVVALSDRALRTYPALGQGPWRPCGRRWPHRRATLALPAPVICRVSRRRTRDVWRGWGE